MDGNGSVAFADFLVLSNFFGTDGVGYEGGDINCDGTVGFPDFLILSNNFGQSSDVVAAVPEPGVPSILALVLLFLFRK